MTTTDTVPGFPYVVYRNGELVSPRHALDGDRAVKVCDDPTHLCSGALVIADGPLAGRDFDRPEYQGRRRAAH